MKSDIPDQKIHFFHYTVVFTYGFLIKIQALKIKTVIVHIFLIL